MILTNDNHHGGSFGIEFNKSLKKAKHIIIATGYIGAQLVDTLNLKLVKAAREGSCKIEIGMIYHSGLRPKQLKAITELDEKLRKKNINSGVYITIKQYHGKVYFVHNRLFLSSSNFSDEGFYKRRECTVEINDSSLKPKVKAYVSQFFTPSIPKPINNVDSAQRKVKKDLSKYKVSSIPFTKIISSTNIELSVDSQPTSSLNLYFDKGRKNKTGKYASRPWYEIEKTTNKADRKDPTYSKTSPLKAGSTSRTGAFNTYIKFKLKCPLAQLQVNQLHFMKIAGRRETLVMILKGKLEESGCLKQKERITSETLDDYERNTIILNKFDDHNYELIF